MIELKELITQLRCNQFQESEIVISADTQESLDAILQKLKPLILASPLCLNHLRHIVLVHNSSRIPFNIFPYMDLPFGWKYTIDDDVLSPPGKYALLLMKLKDKDKKFTLHGNVGNLMDESALDLNKQVLAVEQFMNRIYAIEYVEPVDTGDKLVTMKREYDIALSTLNSCIDKFHEKYQHGDIKAETIVLAAMAEMSISNPNIKTHSKFFADILEEDFKNLRAIFADVGEPHHVAEINQYIAILKDSWPALFNAKTTLKLAKSGEAYLAEVKLNATTPDAAVEVIRAGARKPAYKC